MEKNEKDGSFLIQKTSEVLGSFRYMEYFKEPGGSRWRTGFLLREEAQKFGRVRVDFSDEF